MTCKDLINFYDFLTKLKIKGILKNLKKESKSIKYAEGYLHKKILKKVKNSVRKTHYSQT